MRELLLNIKLSFTIVELLQKHSVGADQFTIALAIRNIHVIQIRANKK